MVTSDRHATVEAQLKRINVSFSSLQFFDWGFDIEDAGDALAGGGLTFSVLDRLSKEFGTKSIDIDCDTGCHSDPGHARSIFVKNPLYQRQPGDSTTEG